MLTFCKSQALTSLDFNCTVFFGWKHLILLMTVGLTAITLDCTFFGPDRYERLNAISRTAVQEEKYETAPPKSYVDDELPDVAYVPYSWVKEKWRPGLSPFEIRWRGYRLPSWARKTEDTAMEHLPPDDKSICFVHIGKTGGSSVGCSLGFNLHCPRTPKKRNIPAGVLPLYTTNTMHNDVNDCSDDMPYYLFPLRDPMERIRSAYLYDRRNLDEDDDHGEESLYMECPFYTLNDLALRGLAKNGNAPAFCKKRAYNAVRGTERRGYHLFYNHGFFLRESQALDSKILVIRTNHMEDDWNSAEVFMGGETSVVTRFPKANKGDKSKKLFDDNHLSPQARSLLCEALCEEIQLYKKIIENAVNLSSLEKAQSLQELSCPVQARARKCR